MYLCLQSLSPWLYLHGPFYVLYLAEGFASSLPPHISLILLDSPLKPSTSILDTTDQKN